VRQEFEEIAIESAQESVFVLVVVMIWGSEFVSDFLMRKSLRLLCS